MPNAARARLLSLTQNSIVNAQTLVIDALKKEKKYRDAQTLSTTPKKRNEGETLMWWLTAERLAEKSQSVIVAALDRPGMAKSGGSGASGGGFTSKTTAPSRRRVLQFSLSVAGSAEIFTATQILETQNSVPSISKFLIPGQSDNWCQAIPDKYLAYWRGHLDLNNVYAQTTDLEAGNLVDLWIAQHPPAPTPTPTPWVVGIITPTPTPWVVGIKPTG